MAHLSEKDKKRRADQAESVLLASQMGTSLGTLGAWMTGKWLGRKLREGHGSIPYEYEKKDIGNLKSHFSGTKGVKHQKDLEGFFGKVFKEKTRDKEIRGKVREIGTLGEEFAKAHKLRERGIKFNAESFQRLGDYYNPIKNTVNLRTADAAVALHEMGHAADIKGSIAKTVARHSAPVAAALAVPMALAYGDAIKKAIPGTVDDKVIDFLQEHPVATALAGYGTSTLYPEAKASFLALSHILKSQGSEKMWKAFSKTLGPAYGTYLAASLPLMGGFALAKMMRDSTQKDYEKAEKRDKKRKSMRKAAMDKNTLKAFLAGGLSVGLPLGAFSYYRFGTEGGKVMGEVDKEVGRRQLTRQYGPGSAKSFMKARESMESKLEEHPVAAAVGIGSVIGSLAGVLTAVQMEHMDVFKKGFLKRAEELQKREEKPRSISVANARLDGLTVESDRDKYVWY